MGQAIILTGATGFLGSNLIPMLLEQNYRVICLMRSGSNTTRIKDYLSEITACDIDLCHLEQPFVDQGVDVQAVIHTATHYGRQSALPSQVVETNLLFPLKLLEIAKTFHVPTFINTHTALNRFVNDYALSKTQFSEWGRLFAETGAIRFMNVEVQNIYGPGADENNFATFIAMRCVRNTPEIKLTQGEQKRDFIYIDNVVSAYRTLLGAASELPMDYHVYELGSGHAVPIRYIVESIHRLAASTSRLVFGALPYRAHEMMFSQANLDALKLLGWSPQHSLETGLTSIIASINNKAV